MDNNNNNNTFPNPTDSSDMDMTENLTQNMNPQYGMDMQQNVNPQYGMGMQQNVNQQYGMYNQPSGKPPKVKKPMPKGKLAGIIAGGVVAVAIVVCGVLFVPKLLKSDKEVVIDAFENTFESGKDVNFMADVIGYEELNAAMKENGYSCTMEYNINSIAGEDLDDLVFNAGSNYDPVNKLLNACFDISYQDNELLSVNLIGDEDNTYVELIDLIEGYISIPNNLSKLQDAPMFVEDDVDLTGLDFTIDYFQDDSEQEVNSGYVNAAEGLWDSVTVEKQGKAKVSVNDKTVKAKEYYVTLSEGNIEEALSDVLDGISEIVLAEPEVLSAYDMDEESFKEGMRQLKSMVPSLINGDFVLKVYVADKKVVKLSAVDKMTIMYVDVNYDFNLDIDGSDVSCELDFEVMDEKVGISFDSEDTSNGNIDGRQFTAQLSYNSKELIGLNGDYTFDNSDYVMDLSLECSIEELGDIGLVIGVSYEDISKGVGYTCNVDKLDISYDGENVLDVDARYVVDTQKVNAEGIDSTLPVYDLSAITYDEYEDMIYDNSDNIMSWLDDLINNSGAFGDRISELIYGESYDYDDDYGDDDYGYDDYDTYTSEDMTLISGDTSVEILDSIDGFELDYACSYFVDYYTENYSMIEYMLETDTTLEDVMSQTTSLGFEGDILNQPIEVNGETLYYSMVLYDEAGDTKEYMIVKELAEGTYLYINAIIYSEDSQYTVEHLAQALDSQYYLVK